MKIFNLTYLIFVYKWPLIYLSTTQQHLNVGSQTVLKIKCLSEKRHIMRGKLFLILMHWITYARILQPQRNSLRAILPFNRYFYRGLLIDTTLLNLKTQSFTAKQFFQSSGLLKLWFMILLVLKFKIASKYQQVCAYVKGSLGLR